MNDETMLREALHDLTFEQPAAPVDRVVGVRRRHVRRRTTQMGGVAAIVAIVAIGAAFIRAPFGNDTEPAHRDVPSWALQWADHRDGSVDQSVLDGAVASWQRFERESRPSTVVWYVGQTAVHDSWVVAVFEAETRTGRHLVAAQAQVGGADPGQSVIHQGEVGDWVIRDAPAPDPTRPPALVGLNLADVTAEGTSNWILVLSTPEFGFHWQAPGSAGGVATMKDGLAVVDTGEVRGQVSVVFDTDVVRNGPVSPIPVAFPGDDNSGAPTLEPATPVEAHGRQVFGRIGGQGTGALSFDSGSSRTRVTVLARCYGGPGRHLETLHLTVDNGPFAANVPCDDQQHEFAGPSLQPQADGHTVFFTGNAFTAFNIAVVKGK